MADIDASFIQEVFDIEQRQRKSDVQHHRQADEFTTRSKVSKWVGLAHAGRVGGDKVDRNLIPLTLPFTARSKVSEWVGLAHSDRVGAVKRVTG